MLQELEVGPWAAPSKSNPGLCGLTEGRGTLQGFSRGNSLWEQSLWALSGGRRRLGPSELERQGEVVLCIPYREWEPPPHRHPGRRPAAAAWKFCASLAQTKVELVSCEVHEKQRVTVRTVQEGTWAQSRIFPPLLLRCPVLLGPSPAWLPSTSPCVPRAEPSGTKEGQSPGPSPLLLAPGVGSAVIGCQQTLAQRGSANGHLTPQK